MTKRNRDVIKEATKSNHPLPIRVLLTSVPATVAFLPILWWLKYPPSEWPFVAGVFCLSLIASGTLVSGVALMAVKQVHTYASAVAGRQGIDIHEPENSTPEARITRAIWFLVIMLLLGMASWGLALYVLGLVMTMMAMEPIGSGITGISLTLLTAGSSGFSLILSSFTWFFYTVDHDPQRIVRFSRRLRYWFRISGQITQNRLLGVPTLAR